MPQDNSHLLPTESDVDFYEKNGYWIAPRILSDAELATLRDHHACIVAGDYETGRQPWARDPAVGAPIDRVVKVDNTNWADTAMARLALNPIIGAMAARLSRSRAVRLWHDQLLLKPPHSGTVGQVGWHQDYHYWQCSSPAELLTAWVALDDVNEDNGCMKVVPGSHRWGLQADGNFFNHDLDGLQKKIEETSGHTFHTESCILPAGSLSFHHCLTVHGSGANNTPRPRRSLVVHLMPEGTSYKAGTSSDGHMNVRLLSGANGDPFIGPYFPVLYREGSRENPWNME